MTAHASGSRSELVASKEFEAFLFHRYPRSVKFFVERFEAWKADQLTTPPLFDMDGDDYNLVVSLVDDGLLFDIERLVKPQMIWIPIDPMDPHEYWIRREIGHYYDEMCSNDYDAPITPYDWSKHHRKKLREQIQRAKNLRPTVESYGQQGLKKAQVPPPTVQPHGQIPLTRECKVCGADLKDRHKKAQFCSPACRVKDHRRRKKLL